jgi:hypothetical protein
MSLIERILQAICHEKRASHPAGEVGDLERILRLVGSLLSKDQLRLLANMDQIKAILAQDNGAGAETGCQGSLGGFGTEELLEWERLQSARLCLGGDEQKDSTPVDLVEESPRVRIAGYR